MILGKAGAAVRLPVFVKCLVILAATTAAVAGALAVSSDRTLRATAEDGIRTLAQDVTLFKAETLVGATRFRKVEDIQASIEETLAAEPDRILGVAVVASDGAVLATAGDMSPGQFDQLATLGAAAVSTGAAETTGNGFWHAFRYPQGGDPIGALAAVNEARQRQLALAGGVFLVLTIASGLFFRQTLAVPLLKVARRTTDMADGDLTSDIPATRKGDEIGLTARQLDILREKLHAAEASTRDAIFQSAGFENASVALVMTDADFRVTHFNPAFQKLASAGAQDLRHRVSDLDPEALENLTLDPFTLAGGDLEQPRDGATHPASADVVFGARTISLTVAPIEGDGGTVTGYVMEWDDVTSARVTEAVLSALEAAQMRFDFDRDHRLTSANDAARTTLGPVMPELGRTRIGEFIAPVSGEPMEPLLASKAAAFDTFRLGSETIVSGTLSPIVDSRGAISGHVFLGLDITGPEKERTEAHARQEALTRDQKTVVEDLSEGLTTLSTGDLSVRLTALFPPDYEELRQHFNASVEALDAAVSVVRENSGAILSEAGNISGAADDLSRRTEQQAATLEQFAAALTELTTSVSSTADGAREASEVVTSARNDAESSGTVVQEAVEAMGEIESSSERISRIISVIDDIAFQTNLLALKAGVEAARAGDAGRGFAVVASEVRALAQRSSDAAREINELISSSGAHVRNGVSLVGKAGGALTEIVSSIGNIADHVTGIAASAREQATGLDEINVAMGQLDQATQQNVAMFEETTAATHTLRTEATSLADAAGRFRTSGTSTGRAAPAGPKTVTHSTKATPAEPAASAAMPPAIDGALALADEDDDWEDF
ncbi:MAG: methyl-accepting chemotaxis protein [Paracoccaceae bacterium]|nr:methyl-accepting chemotaxis protein [Paracoccaceae bacterium]